MSVCDCGEEEQQQSESVPVVAYFEHPLIKDAYDAAMAIQSISVSSPTPEDICSIVSDVQPCDRAKFLDALSSVTTLLESCIHKLESIKCICEYRELVADRVMNE